MDRRRTRAAVEFAAVSWVPFLLAAVLALSTAIAIWSAAVAHSRRSVPGSAAFTWLMLAIAHWSFTSAVTQLVPDLEIRVLIARVQYLAVAPIGVLWLFFAARFARAAWPALPAVRVALWTVPLLTLAAAITNDDHRLLWRSIVSVEAPWGSVLVYNPGPWYWVHVVYTYALILAGTWFLIDGLRRFPPPYRPQTLAAIVGMIVPWAGNMVYLARVPALTGVDLTPVGFTASGLCFLWGLYRYRLFGLVPIARDLVVDSMEDGVLVLDAQRRLIDLNQAGARFSGTTPANIGRHIDDVVPWWAQALTEERRTGAMPVIVRMSPGPRYFEVAISPVRDPERRFAGWLVVVRDVTARKRAESERYALERRVQEQQKAESLKVFAAGAAHDFNNMLTGVLGNADLLAMQAPPGSAQRQTAEAIVIGAQRAADLVSKLLAYAGEGRVVSERVDMDTLTREMVDLLSASVGHQCTLTYRSPGPIPTVDADPTQIRQVVLNLIVNATEAVDLDGMVTVATGQETLDRGDLAQMTFGTDGDPGSYVFVDVVDTGPGMDDDTLQRIFDPFFSTKDQGRGLGLAAVRGIVRSHDGVLRVTTKVGQGTRFRVWLPLTPGKQFRTGY